MSEGWRQWQGRTVNNQYPLQAFLGGSDHSAVFLTVAPDGTKAAIKLTAPAASLFDAQITRWREISDLDDPRLIRILDSGKCDLDGVRMLYVVMEYADENLGQVLADRALTAEEARATMPSVLESLDFAHGRGFIHNRIKPTNILAIGDRVKLSSDSLLRQGEQVDSSVASVYDPPEAGKVAPSVATDVWQFGVTLVEALTQRRPGPGQSGQSLSESVPETFRELVRNCLALDPARRSTVGQLRRGIAANPGIASRPTVQSQTTAPVTPARPAVPTVPVSATVKSQTISRDLPRPTLVPATPHRKIQPKWPIWAAVAAIAIVALILFGRSKRTPQPTEQPVSESQSGSARQSGSESPNSQPDSSAGAGAAIGATSRSSASRSSGAPSGGSLGGQSSRASSSPADSSRTAVADAAKGGSDAGVVQRVMPQISPSALRTVHGTLKVRIRVNVDEEGNVSNARFESPGPSKYFSRLSMDAARDWKFSPAQNGNRSVKLLFAFTRGGTEASATREN